VLHRHARALDVPVVVSYSDLADPPEPGWMTFLTDEAIWSRCCQNRARVAANWTLGLLFRPAATEIRDLV
jgi:hypothetical protein